MSIYPSDYVQSYIVDNRDWLAREMRERAEELLEDDALLDHNDLYDYYTVDQAIDEVADTIAVDVRWEIESEVQDAIDGLAEEIFDEVKESKED